MKALGKAIFLVALCLMISWCFAQSVSPSSFTRDNIVWMGECPYNNKQHECFAVVKDNKKYMMVGGTEDDRFMFETVGTPLFFYVILEFRDGKMVVVWSKDKEV